MDESKAAEIEALGAEWSTRSDEFLVGYVARQHEPGFHTPAIVEMQRRLVVAIQDFNTQSSEQTAALIELVRESGQQNATMIRLTGWVVGLTVVLVVLTVVLGLIAGLQLWAMLKGGV
jgi:hypothetical protein